MFAPATVYSGFAVRDLGEAAAFYRDVLGVEVDDSGMGLALVLPDGTRVFVYPKPDHEPAVFTILNFQVPDVVAAVHELRARGVETKIYADTEIRTDELGIMHGRAAGHGPDIAWFRDPSGNVLAVHSE